ncbi:MAG: hypothetical protein M1840_000024 [Geoglossum simile]|nr:MAG: hypothetical protein M1840_000024 [Geoglossum simile]
MPSVWDVGQEKKLLLAIIDLTNPKPPQWPRVAEKLGPQYTAEACRQHYQKIRRLSSTIIASSNDSTDSSPSKRAAKTKKAGKRKLSNENIAPAGKRKLSNNKNIVPANDDSEPEMSLTKKVKEEILESKVFKIKSEEGSSKEPINLEGEDG